MSSPIHALCLNNEDINLLSAMAVCGDFAPLLNATVDTKYMRPPCREVADFVLSQYMKDLSNFPPSFEDIQVQFDKIPWPKDMAKARHLDVQKWVESFSKQAIAWVSMEAALQAMSCSQVDLSEDFEGLDASIQTLNDRIEDLRAVGRPSSQGGRFGKDPTALMATCMGKGISASHVEFPWDELNKDMGGVFYSGIYAFFARPKNGKSHALMQIAHHNGVTLGRPGLYVDIENAPDIIETRLVCIHGGLNLEAIEAMKGRCREEDYVYTDEDLDLMDPMRVAIEDLASCSQIHIINKDSIQEGDPFGSIGLRQILRTAKAIHAEWVCLDQIQAYYVEGKTSVKANEVTRAYDVASHLSNQNLPFFVNTQERRGKVDGKNYEFEVKNPRSEDVFGADAVAQKCTYLAHVQAITLLDDCEYVDSSGATHNAKFLRIFQPTLSRNGKAGSEYRVFTIIDNYGYSHDLEYEEGLELYSSTLSRKKDANDQEKRRAKRGGGGSSSKQGQPYIPD